MLVNYNMDVINNLSYIYGEVFWLKEALLVLQSFVVFALVWWFATLKQANKLLAFLSALIGIACSILGDMGYWNDNDTLKHIAPAALYLIVRNDKEQRNDIMLFAFLCPFFLISYEFYRSIFIAAFSILSHLLIFLFIYSSRRNIYLTLLISTIIGLLYNYVGDIAEPGTNDILVNPVLVTLYIKGIDYYMEKDEYTTFLKYFWIVLLCYAYFGSWVFCYIGDYYSTFAF